LLFRLHRLVFMEYKQTRVRHFQERQSPRGLAWLIVQRCYMRKKYLDWSFLVWFLSSQHWCTSAPMIFIFLRPVFMVTLPICRSDYITHLSLFCVLPWTQKLYCNCIVYGYSYKWVKSWFITRNKPRFCKEPCHLDNNHMHHFGQTECQGLAGNSKPSQRISDPVFQTSCSANCTSMIEPAHGVHEV
jgi:hypothetical protein